MLTPRCNSLPLHPSPGPLQSSPFPRHFSSSWHRYRNISSFFINPQFLLFCLFCYLHLSWTPVKTDKLLKFKHWSEPLFPPSPPPPVSHLDPLLLLLRLHLLLLLLLLLLHPRKPFRQSANWPSTARFCILLQKLSLLRYISTWSSV